MPECPCCHFAGFVVHTMLGHRCDLCGHSWPFDEGEMNWDDDLILKPTEHGEVAAARVRELQARIDEAITIAENVHLSRQQGTLDRIVRILNPETKESQ